MDTRVTELFLFGCGVWLIAASGVVAGFGAVVGEAQAAASGLMWLMGVYAVVKSDRLRRDRLGPKSRDYEEWRAKQDEKR